MIYVVKHIPCGIHVKSMDSTWNKSVPHGFHVECGGMVKYCLGGSFPEGEESILFGGGPYPRRRAAQTVERCGKTSKVANKSAVEVDEPKELLDILFVLWHHPWGHGFDLLWVHLHGSMSDDDAEVLNFLNLKDTLLKLEGEVVVKQDLKYLPGDEAVGRNVICEDQDIIHVDNDMASWDEVLENDIHHCLKCRWQVRKPKEHHKWFEQSTVCDKCSLVFIAFFDADIVEAPADIYLREVVRAFQLVHQLRDQRQWVTVFDCHVVQAPVVLDRSQTTTFLFDKEEGCHK